MRPDVPPRASDRHPDDNPLCRCVLEMLLDEGYAPNHSGIIWIMRYGTWFASTARSAEGENDSELWALIVASAPASASLRCPARTAA